MEAYPLKKSKPVYQLTVEEAKALPAWYERNKPSDAFMLRELRQRVSTKDAEYAQPHQFQPGQMSSGVWNKATRKWESQPNPNFCKVCGRKADHVLHTTKAKDSLPSKALAVLGLYALWRLLSSSEAPPDGNYDLTQYRPKPRAFDAFQVTAIGMHKVAEAKRRTFQLMAHNSAVEAENLRKEGNLERSKKFLAQEAKWLAAIRRSDEEIYKEHKNAQ